MQENKLLENENLLKKAKTHKFCVKISKVFMFFSAIPIVLLVFFIVLAFAHYRDGILTGIVMLGFFSLFALNAMSTSIKRITQETIITNKRIILNAGWINKTTTEITPEKIESITVEQGLFGKMYGFGNLCIHGLGGTKDEILFTSEPFESKEIIQKMIQTNSKINK